MGFHVRGEERKAWLRALVDLQAGIQNGMSFAEFGALAGKVSSAYTLVARGERLPVGDSFISDNEKLVASLDRTKTVWGTQFPQYPSLCDLRNNLGWGDAYCGKLVIDAVEAEGIKFTSDNTMINGRISLTHLASAMMSSNSRRIDEALNTHY